MGRRYKVVQWATGSVGRSTLRRIIDHRDLELVGLYTYGAEKAGVDAGTIAKRPPVGVKATNSIEEILELDADIVVHTSRISVPYAAQNREVAQLLASGKNVISVNGFYMPHVHGPAYAAPLLEAATKGDATLAGIGVNPGVIAERLALTLTGLMTKLEHIECLEVVDCSHAPSPGLLFDVLGFGLDPVESKIERGPLAQLYLDLYAETFAYMAEALGTRVASIEPDHRITLALEDIRVDVGVVPKGKVAGTEWRWNARFDDGRTMTHSLLWTVKPQLHGHDHSAHWKISTRGRPNIQLDLSLSDPDPKAPPSRPAMDVTASVLVRAIPEVCAAPAGFYKLPAAALPFKDRF